LISRLNVNIVILVNKKDITLGVRVDSDLEKTIKALAEKEDRSVSWILRDLIVAGLKAKKLLRKNKPAGR
jgi:predicted transcriptional regulator